MYNITTKKIGLNIENVNNVLNTLKFFRNSKNKIISSNGFLFDKLKKNSKIFEMNQFLQLSFIMNEVTNNLKNKSQNKIKKNNKYIAI